MREVGDVHRGISVDDDQVGELAWGDGAEILSGSTDEIVSSLMNKIKELGLL